MHRCVLIGGRRSRDWPETTLGNLTGEAQAFLDYDILEANRYLMSGFTISQIDRWFTGPAPQFNPGDLFTTRTPKTLEEALRLAYAALQDPSQTAWQPVGGIHSGGW